MAEMVVRGFETRARDPDELTVTRLLITRRHTRSKILRKTRTMMRTARQVRDTHARARVTNVSSVVWLMQPPHTPRRHDRSLEEAAEEKAPEGAPRGGRCDDGRDNGRREHLRSANYHRKLTLDSSSRS